MKRPCGVIVQYPVARCVWDEPGFPCEHRIECKREKRQVCGASGHCGECEA